MHMPEPSQTITLNANAQDEVALARLLFAHVPEQDVAAYEPEELAQAAKLAKLALLAQKQGERLIQIDHGAVTRAGTKVSTITLVNDNRPFLLDSAMAEMSEQAGSLYLVAHPVLDIGAGNIAGSLHVSMETANPPLPDKRRVSLIQFHVTLLSEAQTRSLQHNLAQLLKQGEAAVHDWRAMVAHIEALSKNYRAAPPRGREKDAKRSADFLDWLCDDNFIFLGLRDRKTALGILQDGLEEEARFGKRILNRE